MSYEFSSAGQKRLSTYLSDDIGLLLRNKNQRASFATYALGILGDAERKSVEPIAARAAETQEHVDALHQRLLHLLGGSVWEDDEVRLAAARYGIQARVQRAPIQNGLIDVHPGPNRGVQQANFAVLRGSYMPAVLVELGFGSNQSEATFLSDQDNQRALARNIAESVVAYLAHYESRVGGTR